MQKVLRARESSIGPWDGHGKRQTKSRFLKMAAAVHMAWRLSGEGSDSIRIPRVGSQPQLPSLLPIHWQFGSTLHRSRVRSGYRSWLKSALSYQVISSHRWADICFYSDQGGSCVCEGG